MVNLNKAFETDNGVIVQGVVIPDSIFNVTRSLKPTYSGDFIVAVDYYNSLTQVDANRIARESFTYTDDFVVSSTLTYYDTDGTTALYTESFAYNYSGDTVTDIEVT